MKHAIDSQACIRKEEPYRFEPLIKRVEMVDFERSGVKMVIPGRKWARALEVRRRGGDLNRAMMRVVVVHSAQNITQLVGTVWRNMSL